MDDSQTPSGDHSDLFAGKRFTGSRKGRVKPTQLLRDLRWAYEHSHDELRGTPKQESFREQFLNEATKSKFIDLLAKQEQAHRSRRPGSSVDSPVSPPKDKPDEPLVLDAGTEKSLDVIERLIREEEEQNGPK